MASVMEIIVRARDQASNVIQGVGDRAEQAAEQAEVSWDKVAATTGVAGAALEGLARRGQASQESLGRMSASLGESEEELRDAAVGVEADFGEVVAMMETGRRQGIESSAQLAEYAGFWDRVGDAAGESNVQLADSAVALRAVGVEAGREEDALDALGFITEETSGSVGEFLRFLERTGPELNEIGADIDDAAALLGLMETEFGLSGRTARQEFRTAINDSDGTLQGMLDTLGISEDQFSEYRDRVSESSDVIGRNADITAESETALFKLQERIGNFLGQHGQLVEDLSSLSPVLMG
ncbi:MAG: hypothetical protein ACODAF_01565, partial [Actinomycetota bacterium]